VRGITNAKEAYYAKLSQETVQLKVTGYDKPTLNIDVQVIKHDLDLENGKHEIYSFITAQDDANGHLSLWYQVKSGEEAQALKTVKDIIKGSTIEKI